MTKEEILVAIRECAEKIGHAPSLAELRLHTGVEERHVRKYFLRYQRALAECGMMRGGRDIACRRKLCLKTGRSWRAG